MQKDDKTWPLKPISDDSWANNRWITWKSRCISQVLCQVFAGFLSLSSGHCFQILFICCRYYSYYCQFFEDTLHTMLRYPAFSANISSGIIPLVQNYPSSWQAASNKVPIDGIWNEIFTMFILWVRCFFKNTWMIHMWVLRGISNKQTNKRNVSPKITRYKNWTENQWKSICPKKKLWKTFRKPVWILLIITLKDNKKVWLIQRKI